MNLVYFWKPVSHELARHEFPKSGFSYPGRCTETGTRLRADSLQNRSFFAGLAAGIPACQIPAGRDLNPFASVPAHGNHLLFEPCGRKAARMA